MKRNRVLKHLFLLATPAIISIASVSCSSPKTPPQKGGGSQGTPGSETTPPNNNGEDKPHQEPGTQPQPSDQKPEPENPTKTNSNPNQGDKKDEGNPNPGTVSTPSLSVLSQQLKAEIEKLSLYNDRFTKEVYEQYFKNLKEQKVSFINSKYNAEQFDKDVTLLEKYYSQVLELSEVLKTKSESEVKTYVDSLKSQNDSILKFENGVASVNVSEINSLQSKINLQNGKNVEERNNSNPRFTFTTKGSSLGPKSALLSSYAQKVIQQLSNLSLYARGNTIEKYNQFFASLNKDNYVTTTYTQENFKRDILKLKLAYAQVAVLDENLNTMNDLELMKYLKEEQKREDSIVKSVENLSFDFERVNQLFLNILTSGFANMQAEDIEKKKEYQETTGLATKINPKKVMDSGSSNPTVSSMSSTQPGNSNPGAASTSPGPSIPSGSNGSQST
ncbi:hypothetical protein NPA08_02750 [Mycoplasmopsis citelli]|uniref:proline-rich domain-containing protein n=1 Tax=Mycoplasmopsis citelli TaxID=171281 RepID=UPI002115AF6C|nr:proline-rich domain-containing protein [Mycoplasmopsis citelli]UUD35865.1 hypothetical protein NPA08_02750 [Mycoplasmopsis citelli]